MSFILDALRKSENERQRQGGPGLAEVAVAAPKTKTSVWATAAVVLLLANLVAVGVLMLRRARAPDETAPVTQATSAATPHNAPAEAPPPAGAAPPSASPPATAAATQQAPATAAPAPGDAASGVPPMLQPADAAAPGSGMRNPLEDEVSGDSLPLDPVLAERTASIPGGPPAVSEYPTRPGSVIYEQVPDAGSAGAQSAPALPTIDEIGLQGSVPELHIDLHVYAENPGGRFVFINKRKYREGETLQEGPRVEAITRDGVILDQHGRRFILPRQ